jgi:hypothetical protein
VVCGYAVDWLRSCYSSTWRLFRGSPIITPGRYWFSAPGDPHYPGLHYYGSEVWTSDEREPPPTLGEVPPAANRPYFKGSLPVAAPPAVLLGTADCVASGETAPPAAGRTLIAGIDARCWPAGGQVAPPAPPWGMFSWGGLKAGGASLAAQFGRGGVLGGGTARFVIRAKGGLLAGGGTLLPVRSRGGLLAGGATLLPVRGSGGLLADGRGLAQQLGRGGVLGGGAATILTGGITTGCMVCPGGAAKKWRLIVSGFTGVCAALNGTWTLTYINACLWEDSPVTTKWTLSGGPTTWTLLGNAAGNSPSYTHSNTGWACLGSNTLPLAAAGGCTGAPASLTIAPI